MIFQLTLDRLSSEKNQNGAVSSLTNDQMLVGDSFYGWMGYTIHSFFVNGKNFVAISSPQSSSQDGIGGKVEIRDVNNLSNVVTTLYGNQEFENFGHSITSGKLYIEVGIFLIKVNGKYSPIAYTSMFIKTCNKITT